MPPAFGTAESVGRSWLIPGAHERVEGVCGRCWKGALRELAIYAFTIGADGWPIITLRDIVTICPTCKKRAIPT